MGACPVIKMSLATEVFPLFFILELISYHCVHKQFPRVGATLLMFYQKCCAARVKPSLMCSTSAKKLRLEQDILIFKEKV